MDPERELAWLRRVRDLSRRLAAEVDVRRLLPAILDAAIELCEAERGFLVRVLGRKPDGGWSFKVEVARGFDRATLQGGQGHVSRTVVRRVLEREGRGLVTTSEEDQDVIDASSIQARRVRSILGVPLRLRGETRGVLYLDHRFDARAFTDEHLPLVAAFADQAALCLETADLLADRGERRELHALHQVEELEAEAAGERAPARAGAIDSARPAGARPSPSLPAAGLALVRFGGLLGGAPAMQALFEDIERAARSWAPVLIRGESGTGKELVARELHARGARADASAPFLAENCAAVADGVLESELFGHVRGAFTGADAEREGLFVRAGRGTLLLDEVGDMSLDMQKKLLRVLQEGAVRPMGAAALVPVQCRIVAATHRDLPSLVAEGRFREDLFYRLDVLRILVPPLRQRASDIPLLVEYLAARAGATNLRFTDKALELLSGYAWPGNVRQLDNEVRRLAALGAREVAHTHLSPEVREGRGVTRAAGAGEGKTLGEVERGMVEAALRACGGNKARAARQLGIPRSTLYHLIDRYGLA